MIELEDIGMFLFVLLAQLVLLAIRNTLDIVTLILVALLWRRQ